MLSSKLITYRNTVAGLQSEQLIAFFDGWPEPPESERRLEIVAAADHAVLACDGERVVGFATAISDGTFSAFVNLLEVLPDHRRRGIGSELVRRLLREIGDLYMVDDL